MSLHQHYLLRILRMTLISFSEIIAGIDDANVFIILMALSAFLQSPEIIAGVDDDDITIIMAILRALSSRLSKLEIL